MGDLIAGLLPEMLGLLATPAAVVGCVLLLESKRPLATAGSFAGGFLAQYVLLAAAALIGSADRTASSSVGASAKSWIGLGVGILLVLLGIVALLRRAPAEGATPQWMTRLETVGPGGAFIAGVALSIVNPNVVILLSGMSIVTAADVSTGQQLAATGLLLASCALDFAVPIAIFLGLGQRADAVLGATKTWLMQHNRALSVAVLLGFGVLFVVRGVRAVT